MTEKIYYTINENTKTIHLTQSAGFFSCCSVRLNSIVTYFNLYGEFPKTVDSSHQFFLYKLSEREHEDVTFDFFEKPTNPPQPNPPTPNPPTPNPPKVDYLERYQFSQYKNLDYSGITPFIIRYFSPVIKIRTFMEMIEKKYNIKHTNTCVLFYRGNDKATETRLPEYEEYVKVARGIMAENPNVRFLVQSDETEFIDYIFQELGGAGEVEGADGTAVERVVLFKDEIRHINKKTHNSVDNINIADSKDTNYFYSKLYLAITVIMSRCNWVVCNTGNCSIWIALYRGTSAGIIQLGEII
jgi:hypothetical protein